MHINYRETGEPDRAVDLQPDLHVSVTNAISTAQIPDKISVQTNATSLGHSCVALNIATTSRNTPSLNADVILDMLLLLNF